ncbi:tyrosine-type recombinase/integrase [Legionella longbeachae]|nr:tyrosine-type recombinase/integrase [Legionella longbeachae]RZV26674.1 site-specific integrase [Legionella longbeachae]
MLGLSFIFSRTKLDHFMDGLFDKIDRGIKRMLEKYSEIAGLRRTVLPYQSRHFLFTWLKTKGIDDALIQPYSDHENRASLEIYSKLSLSDAQESYDDNIKDFPV